MPAENEWSNLISDFQFTYLGVADASGDSNNENALLQKPMLMMSFKNLRRKFVIYISTFVRDTTYTLFS